MYVHVCYIILYHCTVCVSIGTLFVDNLSFDVDEDLLREFDIARPHPLSSTPTSHLFVKLSYDTE